MGFRGLRNIPVVSRQQKLKSLTTVLLRENFYPKLTNVGTFSSSFNKDPGESSNGVIVCLCNYN